MKASEAEVTLVSATSNIHLKELHGLGLGSGVLVMLNRQIEEGLKLESDMQIEAVAERLFSHRAGKRICGECVSRTAVHVAWKLVEQDQ